MTITATLEKTLQLVVNTKYDFERVDKFLRAGGVPSAGVGVDEESARFFDYYFVEENVVLRLTKTSINPDQALAIYTRLDNSPLKVGERHEPSINAPLTHLGTHYAVRVPLTTLVSLTPRYFSTSNRKFWTSVELTLRDQLKVNAKPFLTELPALKMG